MENIYATTDNSKHTNNPSRVNSLKNITNSDAILLELSKLLTELKKTKYDKSEILRLYYLLHPYITIEEGEYKLFSRSRFIISGIKANGVYNWEGSISFNWNKITNRSYSPTSWVARQLANNILCLIEIEDHSALRSFSSDRMYDKSNDYQKALNAYDYIGIDINILSDYPVKKIQKHDFKKDNYKSECNPNCLEVELELPDGCSLFILLNHMSTNKEQRRIPAVNIHNLILKNYSLLNGLSIQRA